MQKNSCKHVNPILQMPVSDTVTWCLTLAWVRSSEASAPCLGFLWSPSQSLSSSPTSRGSIIKTRGRTRERHRRWVTTKIWETLMIKYRHKCRVSGFVWGRIAGRSFGLFRTRLTEGAVQADKAKNKRRLKIFILLTPHIWKQCVYSWLPLKSTWWG